MNSTLYVTNLASNTTEPELRDLFEQAGRVFSLQLHTDPRSHARNRYGVIEMENPEMTQAAIEQVNHYVLHERRMKVVELHESLQTEGLNQEHDTFGVDHEVRQGISHTGTGTKRTQRVPVRLSYFARLKGWLMLPITSLIKVFQ